jgi:hypothetical protein
MLISVANVHHIIRKLTLIVCRVSSYVIKILERQMNFSLDSGVFHDSAFNTVKKNLYNPSQ